MKKEIKELTECSTLEELFETWQAKQVEEVNKLSEAIHNSPEKICVSEIFIKEQASWADRYGTLHDTSIL